MLPSFARANFVIFWLYRNIYYLITQKSTLIDNVPVRNLSETGFFN